MTTALLPKGTEILKEVDVKEAAPDDLRFWSITTIIGALDTPALVYWSAETTAQAAVKSIRTVTSLIEEQGEEGAVEWLKGARFRMPRGARTAAQLGTAVHALLEEYALTGNPPQGDDETRPFLEQFDRWAQVYSGSIQHRRR